MRLDGLGLDPRIVGRLAEDGIESLYPPQEEAVGPALAGENLVVSIPTASGKSLVAYLAMLNSVLRGGKGLYIVPLKALASEKYDDLSKFEDMGIRVGESTGDFDEIDAKLSAYDIVVATSEKVDSLLRHRSRWLKQITVVVADEVHLMNDPDRGPTLEVILVKFRTFNPDAQLIALSATLKNSDELADWLGARLVLSEWRPVPLKEGVCADGEIFFTDNSRRSLAEGSDPIRSIVSSTLEEGGQCLVFVNTRRSTESLASGLGPLVRRFAGQGAEELARSAKRLLGQQEEPTALGSKLGRCVRNGVAFHHAGLTTAQRKFVESNFRKGALKVIAATPTLAAGINLPARTVIVRDVRRYDSNMGYVAVPVLEVRQMCGRAGRPRYDPYGEAILIAKSEEERAFMLDTYLLGENENLFSKLGTEPAIRSHVLGLVATKDASNLEDLVDFFGRTFLAHQIDVPHLEGMVSNVLSFLQREGMVTEGERFRTTTFGKMVSDVYIDPDSAVRIRDALSRYRPGASFGLIHMICSVPDMIPMYLRQSDYGWIEEYLEEVEDQLLIPPPDDIEKHELFLAEVKTARLINDWISEVSESAIEKTFGVGPGDIRNKVEVAEWLMHASTRLAGLWKTDAAAETAEIDRRISYGIKAELLDLVKLKGIGRVRARALFDRGIRSAEDLRHTSYDKLKQIPNIGESVAGSIKRQLGQADGPPQEDSGPGQRAITDF